MKYIWLDFMFDGHEREETFDCSEDGIEQLDAGGAGREGP